MTNIQRTKSGIYRYRKVVPSDLRDAIGKSEILKTLDTKDERIALLRAMPLDKQYDELFSKLRSERGKALGELESYERARELVAALGPYPHELRFVAADLIAQREGYASLEEWEDKALRNSAFEMVSKAVAMAQGSKVALQLTIRDALKLYLRDRSDKGQDNRTKFEKDRERSIEPLIAHLGADKFVGDVSRIEARSYFDAVKTQFKPETVNKEIYLFKAVFAAAFRESELEKTNPWDGLRAYDDVPDRDKRNPFTLEQGRTVIAYLDTANADLRRIGLISALTGARLKEITGLVAEDLVLTGDLPFLTIFPNGVRTVKNKSSRRVIAPVGPALTALIEAKRENPTGPLFPRYGTGANGATAASAALMKMLRDRVGIKDQRLVWHSWRHTVKDLMRNAGVSLDIQHRILGHSGGGVSANYGKGYDLKVLAEALRQSIQPLL
jgi:site-specific recombinase XerD